MNSESCRKCPCSYVVAIIGAFLIVAGLVWVMRHYTRPEPLGEDRAEFRRKALTEVRNADAEALYNSGFTWENPANGIVRMPITNAMEEALRLWQNPATFRTNLAARAEKKYYVPPPPPNKFD